MESPQPVGRTQVGLVEREPDRVASKERIPGTFVSEYELIEPLGSGGFGDVWTVRSPARGYAAIKFLNDEARMRPEILERFLRECDTTNRLQHPQIPGVHEYVCTDEEQYLVLDHLVGLPLRTMMKERTTLESWQAIVAVLPVLTFAHSRGCIHRDLKPDNILVGLHGPSLLDFGISRSEQYQTLTVTGSMIGTPQYTAPEQALDAKRVSPAADIWSWGVCAYEVLAGRRPFEGPIGQLIQQIMAADPPPLPEALDENVRALVMSCLRRDPEQRPSAGMLQEALYGPVEQRPPSLSTVSEPRKTNDTSEKKPKTTWFALALGLVFLSAVLGVTAANFNLGSPPTEPLPHTPVASEATSARVSAETAEPMPEGVAVPAEIVRQHEEEEAQPVPRRIRVERARQVVPQRRMPEPEPASEPERDIVEPRGPRDDSFDESPSADPLPSFGTGAPRDPFIGAPSAMQSAPSAGPGRNPGITEVPLRAATHSESISYERVRQVVASCGVTVPVRVQVNAQGRVSISGTQLPIGQRACIMRGVRRLTN